MSNSIVALLVALGTSAVVGIGVSIFAKKLPKRDIFFKFFKPKSEWLAVIVGKFLSLKLGSKPAEDLEEGIICTLGYWVSKSVEVFCKKLIDDNSKKLDPDYWLIPDDVASIPLEPEVREQKP